MTQPPEDDERITSRAELLPEEEAAGSDDPVHQAEEILHDSDERTAHPEETGRASTQTSTPADRPGEDQTTTDTPTPSPTPRGGPTDG
jgi:hypothetical protein